MLGYLISYMIFGGILLAYGSDWFIEGSTRVAKHFNVSNFVIGATIVAFGTSLPEIVTSSGAALSGSPGLAVGNAVGSCIANIGIILGISVLMYPLIIKKRAIIKNGNIYLLATILLVILGYNGFSRFDGLILFLFMITYVIYTIKTSESDDEEIISDLTTKKASIFIVVGLLAVILGSDLFIEGAKGIAEYFNVPESIIGFSLVAFGTSLPELASSVAAAKRKLGSIVLGNVIGSNIANTCIALSFSAMIVDIPKYNVELMVNTIMALLIIFTMNREKIKKMLNFKNFRTDYFSKIDRIDGISYILIYLIFLAYLLGYIF
ncbi:calcium/sodium antiporter [Methanococcus maripaludis]|uniref:K+-dependent Na+/Ca+ exchanger n=1 Tax=Methanococcus maripaludis OS7 TaxID=637915 RepID=A0A2Z5PLB5_METMI|nr:calcium/sodium antiporter [Methanococcus maripaludis]BAP62306.1 K+-dependent Na+/Ca+ exchanger [Methanococcus maripaludis OS7]